MLRTNSKRYHIYSPKGADHTPVVHFSPFGGKGTTNVAVMQILVEKGVVFAE